ALGGRAGSFEDSTRPPRAFVGQHRPRTSCPVPPPGGAHTMSRFVDRVVLHLAAGDGGNGRTSVHREKFKPLGGPDGGDGGRGGDVVLVVDPQVHTLLDFHYRPHARAGKGQPGMGGNRNGSSGADLELAVPPGTVVIGPDGEPIADMVGAG